MSDNSDKSVPIIADFGFAQRITDGKSCNKMCGTKNYMALEILENKPYKFSVDIWSFGILLYVLTTGYRFPFPRPNSKLNKNNIDQFAQLIRITPLKFKGEEWLMISDEFKNLLTGMLEKDPVKRLTIEAVLQHPWFQ